jgi:cell division protein ZapA
MSSPNEPVVVRILEREYRVMCAPDERRQLMESALFLDQQMREIRDTGRISSIDKIAVMSALNLAEEVLTLRRQLAEREEQVDRRVQQMAIELERSLPQE